MIYTPPEHDRTLQIAYSYDDVPTIAAWSEDCHYMLRGLMGPFGSGKSSGCVNELIKLGMMQNVQTDGIRRARFAIVRNTYVELKDTTIKTFKEWCPEPEFGTFHQTDHIYYLTGVPGLEAEVLFRALDRPEQVKNLLSLELTAAWVNEAKEVPWAIIEALTGRVGRYPSRNRGGCVNPCIIMDTNPPDDESWWYKVFEEKRFSQDAETDITDAVIYKQPGGLSPHAENLPNLQPDYYKRMAGVMRAERRKVYIDGQYGFLMDGKPVYSGYNDTLHCIEFDVSDKADTLYRGWDFGLTPACTLSQVVGGQWRTFDEFTADNGASLDFRTFATGVLNRQNERYPWIMERLKAGKMKIIDIGDPSGVARSAASAASDEASCFDIAAGLGISMQGGDQALRIRLDSVAYALSLLENGRPKLVVHPRCRKLRKGYQGQYQYRKIQIAGVENRYKEEPDKNEYSHIHDANQYVGARLFGAMLKSQEERRREWSKPINYRPLSIK